MITTTVTIDLSRDNHGHDRRATSELYGIPAGSRVSVYLGDRWVVHPQTASQLRQYVDSVHVDLHGTTRATNAWAGALRSGNWGQLP
jgi:hypothetical protein